DTPAEPPAEPPVDAIDLRGRPDAETAFRQFLESEFPKPFDLSSRSPLFRITLVRIDDDAWYCVLKFHHLIADGLSISLVFGQVCRVYDDLSARRAAPPTERLSYLDLARDDAAYLSSDRYRRDLDYWRDRFRTVPKPLFTPQAHDDRPGSPRYTSALTWQLDWERYERLTEIGKSRGTTAFAVFSGLLAAAIARLYGRRDLVIGVPVLNRPTAITRRTVGMFAGAMPLRLSIPPTITLHGLASQAATRLRQDFRHQRVPINDIVRELRLPQSGRWRLFDVVLSFEPNDYDITIGGTPVEAFGHVGGYELNPLAVYVREYNAGRSVSVDFAFNPSYLTDPEVRDLQQRFALLVDCYLKNPETRLDRCDLLLAAERSRLLAWGAGGPVAGAAADGASGAADSSADSSVVALFLR
ncbi:MAG: condensation domain-containing protein, partial [Stellaceae bacterium]